MSNDWYGEGYSRDTFGDSAFPLESKTPGLKAHTEAGGSLLTFKRQPDMNAIFNACVREVQAEIPMIGYDGFGIK